MSEDSLIAVIVALIGAGALVFATLAKIVWDMRAMKAGIHETREQVQNDHTTGLRDDLDDKHAKQMAALEVISKQLVKSDRRQWKAINAQDAKIKQLAKK